ncbi:beta-ketoacyl reductase [Streptomyces sp. MMG1121]|uniref:beta-ketoacyl reductase n=1 Tax=Streptomyces sp. MMG1121 TaxID=1415544 RepID=UPI003B63916F
MDERRYRIGWQPLSDAAAALPAGTWLAVVPADGAADALVASAVHGLARQGVDVRLIAVDDDEQLAHRLKESLPPRVAGVLAVPATGARTVALARALGELDVRAPLWCLTRGAVAVAPSDPAPEAEAALVWGLGRAIALEHPERWGGLIDLPAILDERAQRRLCRALAGPDDEDQMAVRAAGLFGRRLLRTRAGADGDRDWAPSGTVLVTGGARGAGAQVARWLAGGGAAHIVLPGDGADPDDLAGELRGSGARVTVAACDPADRAALARLLAQYPPDAVVHASGVAEDGPVAELSGGRFDRAVGDRLAAAANLDELTRALDLSAFVVFSSVAGQLGGVGQAVRAMTDAYLDALAERRRGQGLPGTSIAWGPWSTDPGAEALREVGLRALEPDLAAGELWRAAGRDAGAVLAADIDWARFGRVFTMARPSRLLAGLPEFQEGTGAHGGGTDGGLPAQDDLAQRLLGRSEEERATVLLDLVRAHAAAVLGHPTPEAVDPERGFLDMGFASLGAVELRNRLNTVTGLTLAATAVYDHTTPAALADHLRTELAAAVPAPEGAAR